MPELRVAGAFALAALACFSAGCNAENGPPPHEQYVPLVVSGERFLIPNENASDRLPVVTAETGSGPGLDDGQGFNVRFSAAWVAGHVDGFQPVLNGAIQDAFVNVFVVDANSPLTLSTPPLARDVWYGQGAYSQRVISGEREPNTGFFVITPGPNTPGQQWALVETLPVAGSPYPGAPWRPLLCMRSKPLLIEAAKVYTQCTVIAQPEPSVLLTTFVAGENLRIRDAVLQAIGEEILRWRELAERQVREAPSDAPR